MANVDHLERLMQGVESWNKWRNLNYNQEIDLRGVDLDEAILSRANLSWADLRGANLFGSDLSQADLGQANLNGIDLGYVDLRGTIFFGTSLIDTDLSKASIGSTVFADIDLSKTHGLENVLHRRSSSISTSTIHVSKGKIPEIFLRGCGLSDIDIEYAKLANPGLDPGQVTDITYKFLQLYLGDGIQYYSCFISYSSKDEAFAKQLHDDLQNNGVRCWFDREDIKIGDKIRPTIDRQIRLRDKLLVILSENSINSEYVGDEVEAALEEESKSEQLVLFPIRLDNTALDTREDWAAKIKRRRHIGDFSNWQDKSSYQKAFEKLLRDLKATGGPVNGE